MNSTTILAPAYPGLNIGLLILRLGLGTSFIVHGLQKLEAGRQMWAAVGSASQHFGVYISPTAMGLAASIIELAGGGLLVIGLMTRGVALILAAQMVVAMVSHWHISIPANPGQEAVLRAFATGWSHPMECGIAFLALVFTGPGRYCLDAGMFHRTMRANIGAPGTMTTTTVRQADVPPNSTF